jgi:hypothetical protein
VEVARRPLESQTGGCGGHNGRCVDADARVADVDGQCCRQMSDGG